MPWANAYLDNTSSTWPKPQ